MSQLERLQQKQIVGEGIWGYRIYNKQYSDISLVVSKLTDNNKVYVSWNNVDEKSNKIRCCLLLIHTEFERNPRGGLMLEIVPKRKLSWTYLIKDDGRFVGEIDLQWKRDEMNPFDISGESYEVDADIYRDVCYILLRHGKAIAKVKKAGGLLVNRFTLVYGSKEYDFVQKGIFDRGYRISKHGATVGTIEPQGAWTHATRCSLQQTFPLALRVFLVGVVLDVWGAKASDE